MLWAIRQCQSNRRTEGKQEEGAALLAVSQVNYEGFLQNSSRVFGVSIKYSALVLLRLRQYGRQTMFLCSLLCTDGLLVHGLPSISFLANEEP